MWVTMSRGLSQFFAALEAAPLGRGEGEHVALKFVPAAALEVAPENEHAFGVLDVPERAGVLETEVHDAADCTFDDASTNWQLELAKVGVAHELGAVAEVVEGLLDLLPTPPDSEWFARSDHVLDAPCSQLAQGSGGPGAALLRAPIPAEVRKLVDMLGGVVEVDDLVDALGCDAESGDEGIDLVPDVFGAVAGDHEFDRVADATSPALHDEHAERALPGQ